MKKIFLLLVTALFLLSLYGCNTSSSSNNPTEQTTVTNTDDLSLDSDIETTELNHDYEIYNNGKKVDTYLNKLITASYIQKSIKTLQMKWNTTDII